MDNTKKSIIIYSDGACSGNPGPGGWAAILIYNEIEKEIFGFDCGDIAIFLSSSGCRKTCCRRH